MTRRRLDLGERGEIEAVALEKIDGKWQTRKDKHRKADSWRARVHYRGHDGVLRDLSARAATRKEAETLVEARLDERLNPGDLHIKSDTPLVKVAEQWLTQIRRADSDLSDRTVQIYTSTYRRYVDADGSSLRGLTVNQANNVQRLKRFLQGVADTNGSGAARTTKTVISLILGHALECNALTINAARQIRPPRTNNPAHASRAHAQRDRTRSLTREERQGLLDFADKLALDEMLTPQALRKRQAVADLLGLMAGTGARIGEARDIRWEHVNLGAGYINLHGTKTRAARRRLDLPPWLVERLVTRAEQMAAHYRHGAQYAKQNGTETRAEVVARLLAASDAVGATGFVFPSPARLDPEARWDQSNSANAVRSVLDEAGATWAVGHTFRRTVATLLGEAGVPLAKIADQLGHEDPAMTASVYLGRDFAGDKSALAAHL